MWYCLLIIVIVALVVCIAIILNSNTKLKDNLESQRKEIEEIKNQLKEKDTHEEIVDDSLKLNVMSEEINNDSASAEKDEDEIAEPTNIIGKKITDINEEKKQIFKEMEYTSDNLFITGKAGTGKSTLINSALLLPEKKRAKEGVGVSVTQETTLYSSDKLKMIRMYDTQGLDYEISQDYILSEVKRLLRKGLKKALIIILT